MISQHQFAAKGRLQALGAFASVIFAFFVVTVTIANPPPTGTPCAQGIVLDCGAFCEPEVQTIYDCCNTYGAVCCQRKCWTARCVGHASCATPWINGYSVGKVEGNGCNGTTGDCYTDVNP